MTLDGKTYKQIQEALLAAFPSYHDLEMMVRFHLTENLDNTTSNQNNLSEATYDLIKWADSQNKLKKLIEGACKENSENDLLKSCYQEIFEVKQNSPPQTPETKRDKHPVIKYDLTQLMAQLQNELKQKGAFSFAINGDHTLLDKYLMQRIFLELKNRTAKCHHCFDITLYPEDLANFNTAIEQKFSNRYQSNLIELLKTYQNSNLVLTIYNSKIPCKQIEQVAQSFCNKIENQLVAESKKYGCCLVIIWVNIGMKPIKISGIPILQPPEKFDLEDLEDWFYNLLRLEWQIEEVEIPKLVNRIKDCHGYFWDTYREIDKIIHER